MDILKRVRSLLGLERPVFQTLELHVAHGCNLTCESCSHYSNHAHAGTVSLEEVDRWMGFWSRRVSVTLFKLLGGEPTIHPELPRFVGLVRRHWPRARIEIISNGFFLHRHPTLPAILAADPRAHLVISVHHDSPEYTEKLKPIFALLETWRRDHGVTAIINPSSKNWTRRYEGFGDTMLPFDDGDVRSLRAQSLGQRSTDAAARTRHHNVSAREARHGRRNAGLVASAGIRSSGTVISVWVGPTSAATDASAARSKP